MPEGDTIATYAEHLRPWLEGATVREAISRWPRVVYGLEGTTVRALETVGKHLLIRFDDDTTLRVHLMMTGTWHRYDPGERWQRPRGDLAVGLITDEHQVLCFKAPDVERIDDRALKHGILGQLGPDLMRADVDLDEVLARAQQRAPTRMADLLLDQRVACGLGNVFKSELCFLFEVSPFADPAAVPAETLRSVYVRAGELLRDNVGRRRNTTGRRSPDTWVYGRGGKRCLRCGTRVETWRRDADDRYTSWCPTCQPGEPR